MEDLEELQYKFEMKVSDFIAKYLENRGNALL